MKEQQSYRGEDRKSQVLRVLRNEGLGSLSQKLMRFARSRVSKFKSQKGQDRWVIESLRGKRSGYFVDLAASDGVTFSNTWFLENKLGWDGIAIEPNPYFYSRMSAIRKCNTLECVVGQQEGSVRFRIDIGGRGGIVSTDSQEKLLNESHISSEAEIIDIPCRTLGEVLETEQAPADIDYLSLDVEGSEEKVLTGLDFRKHTFYCMTVEAPNDSVKRILAKNNYFFIKEVARDWFLVHHSHPYFDALNTIPIEL